MQIITTGQFGFGLGWVRFNVPLDTFSGHFGDGGVAVASVRIVATVRAYSVCGVA